MLTSVRLFLNLNLAVGYASLFAVSPKMAFVKHHKV